ncbi:helix-turn-helix domain-containing protein [Pseudoflavonifractor capillosus]|uniref:helix-turn-helix domain-containing protein n=1 Tax=Pseudoflavonifractor capillosus TaxID=106588 RepID=UPI00195C76A9|nr:helix-turn-helix transcriptional regulator [Pseudoflavonifractor capillosus]MBM6680057.1 helix-turn-helix transcriptional regulator [Pseudoflavonifractor capillosus]
METNGLKAKMVEYGDTQAKLAEAVGISLSRLNAKLNGTDGAEFTLGEIKKIKKRYGLDATQIERMFF